MKKRAKFLFYQIFAMAIYFLLATSCSKEDDNNSGKTVKDIDGNVYHTVTIGTQVWITENLKTTKYNDGTEIPNVTDNTEWFNLSAGAYCNYDNLESNAAIYGRFYNWYAVNTGKLAPAGWHVPTNEDWNILINYLIANGYNWDGSKVDNKIAKSLASTTGWKFYHITGTPGSFPERNDSTGFTVLPAGYRTLKGLYCNLSLYSGLWSSTEDNTDNATYRSMCFNVGSLYRISFLKGSGFSVRCLRDN